MKRGWIVAGVLAVALAGAGAAAAVGEARERFAGRPIGRLILGVVGRAQALKAELNLTEGQKEAVKTTLQAHRGEIVAVAKPVVEKGRALRSLAVAGASEEKIRAAADELGKAIGDAAVVGARVRADVKQAAGLSEEQARKVAEFRAENEAAVDRFLEELGK